MADVQPPNEVVNWLVKNAPIIAAGAFGGVVRAFTRPERSVGLLILSTMGGALFAFYGSPLLGGFMWGWVRPFAEDAEITRTSIVGLSGFVCGLVGFPVAEGLIHVARRWKDDPHWPPMGK